MVTEQTFTMRLSEEDELSGAIALSLMEAEEKEVKRSLLGATTRWEADELSTAIALSLIDAKTAEAKQNQKLEEAREARKVAEKAERMAIEKFKLAQVEAKVAKFTRQKDEYIDSALSLQEA